MEYYNSYLQMMHDFSLQYNNNLFNIIKQNFECDLNECNTNNSYNAKNNLETIIEVIREYLRQRGFDLVENEACLMCSS